MGESFPLTFIFFRGVETTNQVGDMFLDIGLGVWNLKHSDLVAENSPWIPDSATRWAPESSFTERRAPAGASVIHLETR